MTIFLCVSDVHENEQKLEQIVKFSKGCDAILSAGDDFDKWLNGIDESDLMLQKTIEEFRDIVNRERRAREINHRFRREYEHKAGIINGFYRQAGIPVFATLGNHDPTFVMPHMKSVEYLLGSTAEFQGITIAGLPATDGWTRAANFCPEFYSHLNWYCAVKKDGNNLPSEPAKKLLDRAGTIDIFITHKSYKHEFHNKTSPAYGYFEEDYGIDSGAVAVSTKFRPKLSLFGHQHLPKPVWKRINGRWFLCPGRSAAVKVAVRDNEVVCFEALFYS